MISLLRPFRRAPLTLAFATLLLPVGRGGADDLAAPQLAASARKPDCFVLSVGINKYRQSACVGQHCYRHFAPLNSLPGDVNDAKANDKAFLDQQGRRFATVHIPAWAKLMDRQANKPAIEKAMARLAGEGKAGDWMVLFLSGHGGISGGVWSFCSTDTDSDHITTTSVAGPFIMTWADGLMKQGKNVMIIVDACQSGELGLEARPLLMRTPAPGQGGLALILSCLSNEESSGGGHQGTYWYSVCAHYVSRGLQGQADLNHDGTVTLHELERYVDNRVRRAMGNTQHPVFLWSRALSDNLVVARVDVPALPAKDTGEGRGVSTAQLEAALTAEGIVFQKLVSKDTAAVRYEFALHKHGCMLSSFRDGKTLLLQGFFVRRTTTETVNGWNIRALLSRAVVYPAKLTTIECGLNAALGAPAPVLRQFLRQFDDEVARFDLYLQNPTARK
jgi:hypothetical protein